ncbi:hypothetical protein [Halorussus marinus]|uniref:hypothetical protein n=1 Tax=Halorussus marinus TaxID=2505976 RepID=UPI001092F9C1|nr:hypothetical protein [Halorussus marinus]
MVFDTSRSGSARSRADPDRGPVDEQCLYGEPCHEPGDARDEQALYGEPQHESADVAETWDVELLFARLRNAPLEPDSLGSRATRTAETSER